MNIIENLETLLAAVEAQPETLFDLSHFRNDTECGSNFCTVGLACTIPKFQEMGFKLEARERSWLPGSFSYTATARGTAVYDKIGFPGAPQFAADAADFAFGFHAWSRLFETAGDGEFDSELGYVFDWEDDTANMTDKDLAVSRLKMQIEVLKGEQQ